MATPLAWHPRLPLVAGLAVRHRRAHPWVADYQARTVTLHEEIRAATALTGYAHAPVAWCGDRHLALLTPEIGSQLDATPQMARPVVLEATGPGFLNFLPSVDQLKEHAAASVSTLDITSRSLVSRTKPLLVYGFRLELPGDVLQVDHAEEDPTDATPDGLRQVGTEVGLHLADAAFAAGLIGSGPGMTGPRELAPDFRPPGDRRRQAIGTGYSDAYLTWEPGTDEPGPAVLWIHDCDPEEQSSAVLPESVTVSGRPSAVLELPLHWPPHATVEMLHKQVVGAVRSALRLLPKRFGTRPIVVGGHSFGATLALYALAHLPELVGAIAHSGCYNRTLTPAGFQRERRLYWDVPEVYQSFSALHFANLLDRPVLLVHGAEDQNPATMPEQAVELYRAIVATGGHARLILLPFEGHTFYYRETLERLTIEHRDWLSRWEPRRGAAE